MAPTTRLAAVVALAAWVLGAAETRADLRPDVAFSLGRAFAVGKGFDGTLDQGGFTAFGSALWGWEDRFRFGVSLFAADLGEDIETVVLEDPSGGPPRDYGQVQYAHLGTFGGAWRVDALGPALGRSGRSFATASYGIYRLQADQQGTVLTARTALGARLGLGAERRFTPHHSFGLILAYNRVFNEEVAQRFASGDLEWRWRW